MAPLTSQKEEYARDVCYFLAELLRTHKVALPRAAEIAEKVAGNINLIDTESQFLEFIKVISSEFEEMVSLTQRLGLRAKIGQREKLETQVREFVISSLAQDLDGAFQVLNEAIKEGTRQEELCMKFPTFKQFIETRVWTT